MIFLFIGGVDYVPTMASLTFAPGNDTISHCVMVPLIDDMLVEGSEFFLGILETDEERVTLLPPVTNITIGDTDCMQNNPPLPDKHEKDL
jgi:hypothetical protein